MALAGALLFSPAARAQVPPVGSGPAPATHPGAGDSADERGLAVKSGDSAFVYRVRGVLQVDGRWYLGDARLDDRDTLLIRRARPILEATVLGIIDFRLMPDFAEGRAAVFDAYLDARVHPWLKLRAGKFKPPIGLERLQSDPDLPFMERALTSNLSPVRDVGAQLFGDVLGGFLSYTVGVFNGAPDNTNGDTDANHGKDFAGRLFLKPFSLGGPSPLGLLGIGLAASTGAQRATTSAPGLPTFRTGGQLAFFSYLTSSTDPDATAYAFGRRSRLNPHLYYYLGRLGLLAEYVASRETVQLGDTQQTLTHVAWHATLSVALGGKVAYDGVTPQASLNPERRTWGALELAARLGALSLDEQTFPLFADPTRSPRKATAVAAALNWYLGRNARLNLDFERTWFEGGAPALGDRAAENALLTRMQVTF